MVLYSPRRFGKTSLLKATSNKLISDKILFGYVDFFACNSTEKILVAMSRAAAKSISDDLKSVEKFIKGTAYFFNRIRFSVRFDTDSAGSISIIPELSSQATSMDNLADALNGLNAYLEKNNRRAAIVLDEFQQVIKVDPSLEADFRTIIQQQDRIAFAFLGSRMHLLKDMFINENRPFYHAAKIMELGSIEAGELAKFIRERFQKMGISISDQLALIIAARTNGHPDYTQRLCSHIFDILESDTVSEEHIKNGLQQMLVSLTPDFRGIFEELPLRESQVMTILAEHGPLKIFPTKLIQPYDMGTPALHKALSNLLKKDLIYKDSDKNNIITDPFLAEWIRMVSK
jgi:AAA+ ATPase superfamily predicted ATPase